MYAGYGTGRTCDACGDLIDGTQVEYECVYQDGASNHFHLGCAGVLDAERRRAAKAQDDREEAQHVREAAHETAKHSGDQADVLIEEAHVAREQSRQVKRGGAAPALPLRNLRVLLVEDHDDTREVLTRILHM